MCHEKQLNFFNSNQPASPHPKDRAPPVPTHRFPCNERHELSSDARRLQLWVLQSMAPERPCEKQADSWSFPIGNCVGNGEKSIGSLERGYASLMLARQEWQTTSRSSPRVRWCLHSKTLHQTTESNGRLVLKPRPSSSTHPTSPLRSMDACQLRTLDRDGEHHRISRESQESSDVELMDVEILDSEEEMNPDDPFKAFNTKHPSSAPSGGRKEKPTVPKKRSVTEPFDYRKTKSTVNLLEILLPENYDLTVSQNDFTALHCSTQVTDLADTSVAENAFSRLGEVPEHASDNDTEHDEDGIELQPSNATKENTGSESPSDDSEPELLRMEKIDPESTIHEENDSDEEKELPRAHCMQSITPCVQDCHTTLSATRRDPDVHVSRGSLNDEPATQMSPSATSMADHALPTTDSLSKTTPVHSSPPKKAEAYEPTVPRSTKRKTTLEELCSKTTRVPYRVGLSKRANVNHLHPKLKK